MVPASSYVKLAELSSARCHKLSPCLELAQETVITNSSTKGTDPAIEGLMAGGHWSSLSRIAFPRLGFHEVGISLTSVGI